MYVRRGTNGYQDKFAFDDKVTISILLVALLTAFGVILAILTRPPVISPLPDSGYSFSVQAMEPTPTPKNPGKTEIIAYIAKVWEKEGVYEQARAISCFVSESGLRANAYNFNSNGTYDAGISQLNSIHNLPDEVVYDPYKNIDYAFKLYKRRGWQSWYGAECQK